MSAVVSPTRHRLSHVAADYAAQAIEHGGVRVDGMDGGSSLMALFIIGVQYGTVLARREHPVVDELLAANDGESAAAMAANVAFILGATL